MLSHLFAPFRSHNDLHVKLLAERPGISALDRHFDTSREELGFDRSDWVSVYYDTGNTAISSDGRITATRAITTEGTLVWLVRKQGKQRAFHAEAREPFDAMAEAEEAWRRRAEMRGRKDEVARIVHDLRFLRARHLVTVDDAYASPLCKQGVDGFLRAFGLGRFRRFPGWLIAWLYAFDRQVGYVLVEAHRRRVSETQQLSREPRRKFDVVRGLGFDLDGAGALGVPDERDADRAATTDYTTSPDSAEWESRNALHSDAKSLQCCK